MRLFIFPILVLFSLQSSSQGVQVNFDIDTNVYKVGKPLELWLNFLEADHDTAGAQYWNSAEVERYGKDSYFLIEKEANYGTDNFLRLISYVNLKVLSIREAGEYFKITSLMEFPTKDSTSQVQYIFHVYAGKENGELRLFNALPVNTEMWLEERKVGYVRYHYPRHHTFDLELAQKQSNFLEKFSKDFGVPIDSIDYYFAPTLAGIQRIKGFDFVFGDNGQQLPSGKADPANRIVYSAGTGEYYPHEFIHILLNPHHQNAHTWAHEGVATYFGMSRGKPLDWHLSRLKAHLADHPEINLDSMLSLRTMDQYTDYRYVLGGWVARQVLKKGSIPLLKELLQSGKSDEEYYAAVERLLGIRQSQLDEVIREDLERNY